jgi:hypothetical protein
MSVLSSCVWEALLISSYPIATRRITRSEEVLYLLHQTIKHLWIEFKNLERPFLVASGRRAEKIRKGDYWGESDVEEKAGGNIDGMSSQKIGSVVRWRFRFGCFARRQLMDIVLEQKRRSAPTARTIT